MGASLLVDCMSCDEVDGIERRPVGVVADQYEDDIFYSLAPSCCAEIIRDLSNVKTILS